MTKQWEPGKLSEFFPQVLDMIQLKRTMPTKIAPPDEHGLIKSSDVASWWLAWFTTQHQH